MFDSKMLKKAHYDFKTILTIGALKIIIPKDERNKCFLYWRNGRMSGKNFSYTDQNHIKFSSNGVIKQMKQPIDYVIFSRLLKHKLLIITLHSKFQSKKKKKPLNIL